MLDFTKLVGVFSKLPPDFVTMLKDPGKLGQQITEFVGAANALIEACDAHQKMTAAVVVGGAEISDEDFDKADIAIYRANLVFKAQMAKLPPLPGAKVIEHDE